MANDKFTPTATDHQATTALTGPYERPSHGDTGLYMHIPFCFHKCHYCDFYSIVDRSEGMDRQKMFTDALLAELRQQVHTHQLRPTTIFIGGGTPTLLRPALWRELGRHVRAGRDG